jgi:hypothetical protein
MKRGRVTLSVPLVLLLVVLGALTPLAYATPPDPSWVRGLWDGADFDDIVLLITSGVGVVEADPLVALSPVLACAASLVDSVRTVVLAAAVSSSESRAPPTS